jgi:hypothetical protein
MFHETFSAFSERDGKAEGRSVEGVHFSELHNNGKFLIVKLITDRNGSDRTREKGEEKVKGTGGKHDRQIARKSWARNEIDDYVVDKVDNDKSPDVSEKDAKTV